MRALWGGVGDVGERDMSTNSVESFFAVKYAKIDGAHFFTAHHELSQGLCVGHHDLKTAFDEATLQLKMLLKENHGLECDVEPALTFEQFEAEVRRLTTETPHIRTRIESEVDWRKAKAA